MRLALFFAVATIAALLSACGAPPAPQAETTAIVIRLE